MTDWGPEEMRVIATLPDRPAGLLEKIELAEDERGDAYGTVDRTFAALFNGAMSGRMMHGDTPWFGKAEAEWGWPNAWAALRDAGLVTWEIKRETHPGGDFDYFHWQITDLGWKVRDDDLAYFRERMNARDKDESQATPDPDKETHE